MERLSIVGVLLALITILGGQVLEGGTLGALVNYPAMLIVIGGTVAAVMVQTPNNTFVRALRSLAWVFRAPEYGFESGKETLVRWSNIARKDGLLGLEDLIQQQEDDFIRKSLELLVDGIEPEAIRKSLTAEVDILEHEAIQASRVYEAMGGYSPTMGIIGAVMGLIHVMGNLENPDMLGPGIATAFVATIYGVGLANLFFLPVAHKLRTVFIRQSQYRIMFIEGIIAIADGENPRIVDNRLDAFLHLNR